MSPTRVVIVSVVIAALLASAALGPTYWYVSVVYYPTPDANIGAGLGMLATIFISIPAILAALGVVAVCMGRTALPARTTRDAL